jgi:hypothetical protein
MAVPKIVLPGAGVGWGGAGVGGGVGAAVGSTDGADVGATVGASVEATEVTTTPLKDEPNDAFIAALKPESTEEAMEVGSSCAARTISVSTVTSELRAIVWSGKVTFKLSSLLSAPSNASVFDEAAYTAAAAPAALPPVDVMVAVADDGRRRSGAATSRRTVVQLTVLSETL